MMLEPATRISSCKSRASQQPLHACCSPHIASDGPRCSWSSDAGGVPQGICSGAGRSLCVFLGCRGS
eukprot:12421050-Karenia_brevis.AAC.1